LYDAAYTLSLAFVIWQPAGIVGRLKRTSARALPPDLESNESSRRSLLQH
jgi:hypothetical protein